MNESTGRSAPGAWLYSPECPPGTKAGFRGEMPALTPLLSSCLRFPAAAHDARTAASRRIASASFGQADALTIWMSTPPRIAPTAELVAAAAEGGRSLFRAEIRPPARADTPATSFSRTRHLFRS